MSDLMKRLQQHVSVCPPTNTFVEFTLRRCSSVISASPRPSSPLVHVEQTSCLPSVIVPLLWLSSQIFFLKDEHHWPKSLQLHSPFNPADQWAAGLRCTETREDVSASVPLSSCFCLIWEFPSLTSVSNLKSSQKHLVFKSYDSDTQSCEPVVT